MSDQAGAAANPGASEKRGLATPSARPRPSQGFELWWWLFMRISGLLLLFLAVGHVLIMHVLDGGIDRVDYEFVAARWRMPFWRTWDWLLLSLALVHGTNGLRVVIQDYVRRPQARFLLNWFFYVVTFIIFALGTVMVFTFDYSTYLGG